MGTSEEKTPFKPSKPASSVQEIAPTPYPDWSNSMQAYYGGGGNPNPFFPSPVGSPSPHPYMWGAQHHMMPPYGTPVPYPAMYPPGAVYAHPGMPMPPASGQTNKETVKDHQASGGSKKPKGNLKRKAEGAGGGGGGEKAHSGSGNDNASQSDESVTAGSSDENDNQQQEQGSSRKPSFGQMLADASSQSNTTGEIIPMKPVAPGTNLNIGMDLWSSQAVVAVKDERELKRQKRKQSNRESARRSRLRKQAECEQLQQRVESLSNENQSLRDELQRLSGECEKLKTENNSIQDELLRVHGPEAVADVEQNATTGSKDGEAKI